MTQILQVLPKDLLVDSDLIKSNSWIKALLYWKFSDYKRLKKLRWVSFWWIEIDTKDNYIKRKIGFDALKSPITGLSNITLRIDKIVEPKQEIQNELFNDVWELQDKRDINRLFRAHSKYLDKWRQPDNFEAPIFPSILIDLNNTNDVIKIDNLQQLINQVDFTGHEWSENERLIDSKGNVYQTDYYNFGHPLGVVIPKIIERRINNHKLTEILGKVKMSCPEIR